MSGSTFWSSADLGMDPRWYDDGRTVRAPLSDALADTFSEAASFTSGVLGWMGRDARNAVARGDALDEYGEAYPPSAADPLLTGEEANQRFGITGQLQFQRPLAESSARELQEIRRRDLARQDTLNRTDKGLTGYGALMVAGLAGSLVDPLNLASAFVPVVGGTRAAAWMASAGSRLARAGVAGRIGAIEGTAGALLLEPLQYGLAQAESRDYGAADSLLNVAFGAVMGGLLHGGGRAVVDGWSGWRAPSPETVRGVHETAARAAVAQIEAGNPVNVAPIVAAARAADEAPRVQRAEAARQRLAERQMQARAEGRPATLADLEVRDAEEARGQPEVMAALEVSRALREGMATPQGELSLVGWLVRNGGLRDDGGDLRAIMGTTRARPGLASGKGMSLDEAAAKARTAGYFDEAGPDRPTEAGAPKQTGAAEGQDYDTFGPRDLLAAVDAELRGTSRRYGRTEDAQARAFAAAVDDLDAVLEPHGLTATADEAAIIAALGQGTPEAAPLRTLNDLEAELRQRRAAPEDAEVVQAARTARTAEQAGGGRLETPVGKVDAETAALDQRTERMAAVLQQHVAAGRLRPEDLAGILPPEPAPARIYTGPDVKARFADAEGFLDVKATAATLTREVEEALARGAPVTLTVEGKAVPIVALQGGMIADAQGQRWGLMPLFTGTDQRNRLEIGAPLTPVEQRGRAYEAAAACLIGQGA